MFSNKEKDQIMLEYIEKIINKTYNSKVNNGYIDNHFENMSDILNYYNKSYSVDLQKETLSALKDSSSFESLLKDLNHDINDSIQKDEGRDIQNEEREKVRQEQIDKNKKSANTNVLKELEELAEDEKDITEKDIKSSIQEATIKAIYLAILEKYEINREKIQKHTDRQTKKYGDFTPEDRLAAENRQYEVYLQKIAKKYKSIVSNQKSLQDDEQIKAKEEEISDKHNKEEELKEEKREEEIKRINKLYKEKENIEEEMARMSLNHITFDRKQFEELKEKLYDVDRKLCYEKTAPAVLIENIERGERQEELEQRDLGNKNNRTGVAITNTQNEKVEEKNNKEIENSTMDSLENNKKIIEGLINDYRKYRNKYETEGKYEDFIQAKKIYIKLKAEFGSKENLESNIQDMTKDGKEDYKTESEKNNEIKKNLNLDAVNNEDITAELDLMDAEVDEIAEKKEIESKSMYEVKEVSQNEPKQHTLYGNKRPY